MSSNSGVEGGYQTGPDFTSVQQTLGSSDRTVNTRRFASAINSRLLRGVFLAPTLAAGIAAFGCVWLYDKYLKDPINSLPLFVPRPTDRVIPHPTPRAVFNPEPNNWNSLSTVSTISEVKPTPSPEKKPTLTAEQISENEHQAKTIFAILKNTLNPRIYQSILRSYGEQSSRFNSNRLISDIDQIAQGLPLRGVKKEDQAQEVDLIMRQIVGYHNDDKTGIKGKQYPFGLVRIEFPDDKEFKDFFGNSLDIDLLLRTFANEQGEVYGYELVWRSIGGIERILTPSEYDDFLAVLTGEEVSDIQDAADTSSNRGIRNVPTGVGSLISANGDTLSVSVNALGDTTVAYSGDADTALPQFVRHSSQGK